MFQPPESCFYTKPFDSAGPNSKLVEPLGAVSIMNDSASAAGAGADPNRSASQCRMLPTLNNRLHLLNVASGNKNDHAGMDFQFNVSIGMTCFNHPC